MRVFSGRFLRLRSHSGSLCAHELSGGVAWGPDPEVCVLVRLRSLLAAAHLSLVERVARSDSVLVGRHRHDLALFEHRAPHRLLGLLAARRGVDHLLRLEKKLVDAGLAFDGRSTAHAMHVVRIDRHLLRIDELVDHRLAGG